MIFLSIPFVVSIFWAAIPPRSGAEGKMENRPPLQAEENRYFLFPARQEKRIEKGVFLIADLRLTDPNFSKTVVLITQHGPGGTLGVVINRPTETPLFRAFPAIKEFEKQPGTLFIGGPVQREAVILLFRTEMPPELAFPVFEKVYVAPRIETATRLISRGNPQDRFRVYSGYAGWAPGQLQREIDRGDWRILPGDADLLFQEETASIWEAMFQRSSQQSVEACGRSDACVTPDRLAD